MSIDYKIEYLFCFLGVVVTFAALGYALSLLGERRLKWLCLAWLAFCLGWYVYYFPNYQW